MSSQPRGTREWFKITDTQEFMTMQLLQLSSEAAGGGINRAKNVYTTCAKRVKQLLQEYQQHASQDGDIKVTHQARLDAIQELQKAGINMETMRHFLRKLKDEMQKSYMRQWCPRPRPDDGGLGRPRRGALFPE